MTTALMPLVLATDPSACAWVSANAGSGKTFILVRRVVRCLLEGAPPESILCLTFTKAAAAEMSNRLLAELGKWPAMEETALAANLAALLGRQPDPPELHRAHSLFAQVLDAPGGLKIMTIHSFCGQVLRRFPLEAGLSPGFKLFSDDEATKVRRRAVGEVIEAALSGDAGLRDALGSVVAHTEEGGFAGLMEEMIARKEMVGALISADSTLNAFHDTASRLRDVFRLEEHENAEALALAQATLCSDGLLRSAYGALRLGTATDQKLAAIFGDALATGDNAARCRLLKQAFMTQSGEPRKKLVTKQIEKAQPQLAETLNERRDEFVRLCEKRSAAELVEATFALMRLAS